MTGRTVVLISVLGWAGTLGSRAADAPKPVKVFILAGQSNMEGQAVADLDGKNYNDGKGTLNALLNDPTKAPLVKHLKTEKGEWTVRDDVWVRYQREKQPLLAGPLTMGFSVYGDRHHFGPELQFGHVLGNHFVNQVLLIKTAWGGKSLCKDFRPPSSGGAVGLYYAKMLEDIRASLANLRTEFPAYDGRGYELAGFVWYHGWNDGIDPKNAVPEYEQNLVHLINDVRKDLKAPGLPVVVGELTGPWVEAPGAWTTLRKAQAAAAARPEFKGNVLFVETHDFVRPAKESPNPSHGHHEFGNAETCFLVGDALGKGMVKLLTPQPKGSPEPAKPTSRSTRTIEGWVVRVDDRLLQPPDDVLGTRALRFLEGKLSDIKVVVPEDKLKKLQAVTIVLDLTHGKLGPMQYHPDAGWLKVNGYAPELAKCVHLPRAADLATKRNIREQPWVILHELAHAYHDQVLGFDEPRIKEAYENYRKSGRGDKTLLHNGQRVKHYALVNHKEFFAEMTEAYFGVNDFFPFNRAELKEATPEIFELMALVWEKAPGSAPLRGSIIDAETGKSLSARVYVQTQDGGWLHVHSADPQGSAVPYRRQRQDNPDSVEIHTTVSAHPFVVDLSPGKYTVTVERGKEYHPQSRQVTVGTEPIQLEFKLQRWIDLAARGWYSGDTHVHRSLEELPNVILAEDLNVALPLLHWVTEAFTSPAKNPRSKEHDPGRLIEVDRTHVIYPRNTEYEIFTVGKARHTLGAFFVLNHQTLFDEGVPPISSVAEKAHREGALIELDKHNWPWSMMLVPVMKVDLYELSNNHVWRTAFAFRSFGEKPAEYMKIEGDAKGWSERGWIDFGFQNYYALLNCGYRLRPTAGTASGVHPVPLGFGRVYVQLADGFSYASWIKGLAEGRSFVTTGPMLLVTVNDQAPGHVFRQAEEQPQKCRLRGEAISGQPLGQIEIIVNGQVVRTIKPANRRVRHDAFESTIDEQVPIERSSWVAVRCFEDRADRRVRFAHTSPVFFEIAGKPLQPRPDEIDYLIHRVEAQLARSSDVLPKAALDEYRAALQAYQALRPKARK